MPSKAIENLLFFKLYHTSYVLIYTIILNIKAKLYINNQYPDEEGAS
jgi:hypothetical protein